MVYRLCARCNMQQRVRRVGAVRILYGSRVRIGQRSQGKPTMNTAGEVMTTPPSRSEDLCWEDVPPQMLCKFGCNCRAKLKCLWVHKPHVQQWFEDGQLLLQREMVVECLFCARGECRYDEHCGPVRKVPSSLFTMAVSPGTVALVACGLLHSLGIG